jgi:NADH-quinone oxidoreductase subunit N
VLLLVAVLVPRGARKPVAAFLAFAGFAGSLAFAVVLDDRSARAATQVHDAIFRDRWAALAQVLLAACGAVAVLISYREPMREEHVAEYYALLTAAGAGMAFFVQASNLMTLFLGLEWFSIALYVLTAIDIDLIGSLEAGLKYLIVGAVGSATLLFGSALVYGITGQLSFDRIAASGHRHDAMMVVGLAMVIAGLAFKSSAAPFHMWTPDAYQGAPTPVTAFMSSATKIAALVVTLRVLETGFPQDERLWSAAIAAIAIVSLAWGNIGALVQRNVKRILAYSSVSHAGFMLIAVAAANALGARALMYYLVPYAAMSLGAFAVVAARERELGVPVTLQNLAGLGWERPFLGISMWVFMLGMLGFPLTGGFFGKFYVFAAAYRHGWWWLIVAGVIATMISAYYYLGIIRAMYFRDAAELQLAPAGGAPNPEILLGAGVFVCLTVTVASFFAVQPMIDVAKHAARALPL